MSRIVMHLLGGVNLSQNAVLKKILKILQAVKTSGLTNLHIVYLTTPKCLDSQKKQIWWSPQYKFVRKKHLKPVVYIQQCIRSLNVSQKKLNLVKELAVIQVRKLNAFKKPRLHIVRAKFTCVSILEKSKFSERTCRNTSSYVKSI